MAVIGPLRAEHGLERSGPEDLPPGVTAVVKKHRQDVPQFFQGQAQAALGRKNRRIGPRPITGQVVSLTDVLGIGILQGQGLPWRLDTAKIVHNSLPGAFFLPPALSILLAVNRP